MKLTITVMKQAEILLTISGIFVITEPVNKSNQVILKYLSEKSVKGISSLLPFETEFLIKINEKYIFNRCL